jgi:hypothetical protein
VKNVHPLRTVRRKRQRLEKLECEHPFCLLCGCLEPMLLRRVTRRFLELHHVVSRHRDRDLTLALCFNCHALVTENLHQAGVLMARETDLIKFYRSTYRALAVHHEMLRDACQRFADLPDEQETKCPQKNR